MAMSAFGDKAKPPTEERLAETVGPGIGLWRSLVARVSEAHAPIREYWGFPGKKYGWSLALKRRKRGVVYLLPVEGGFRASTALGEKAVAAALQADLPAKTVRAIEQADRFAEGRAFRAEIESEADIDAVMAVLGFKMA